MSVKRENFGKTKDGKEISLFIISNDNGVKATVTDFGAILTSLMVPNKNGEVKDVVLGYDNLAQYENNSNFFGATIGPNANRVGGAKFTIDGVEYKLCDNDNGNNLHSDFVKGVHKKVWEADVLEDAVKFTCESGDMEMGFPGNKKMSVTYRLNNENALEITYEGISDKKTIFNPTNHTYFALAGHDAGKESLYDTTLWINADKYTFVVPGAIPTGELPEVKGTPMDFTEPKKIGKDIDADWNQMAIVLGYDHNYALNDYDGNVRKVAEASCDGRTMEVYSDLPGIQFYSGNCIDDQKGKDGASYSRRVAFCLETQYFPNSMNQEGFVSPVIDANKTYTTTTIYKFV